MDILDVVLKPLPQMWLRCMQLELRPLGNEVKIHHGMEQDSYHVINTQRRLENVKADSLDDIELEISETRECPEPFPGDPEKQELWEELRKRLKST